MDTLGQNFRIDGMINCKRHAAEAGFTPIWLWALGMPRRLKDVVTESSWKLA